MEHKFLQKDNFFCGSFQLLPTQGIDLSHTGSTDSSGDGSSKDWDDSVEIKENEEELMMYTWKSVMLGHSLCQNMCLSASINCNLVMLQLS